MESRMTASGKGGDEDEELSKKEKRLMDMDTSEVIAGGKGFSGD